eukprot:10077213-Karenia_brevis.AAC.1
MILLALIGPARPDYSNCAYAGLAGWLFPCVHVCHGHIRVADCSRSQIDPVGCCFHLPTTGEVCMSGHSRPI